MARITISGFEAVRRAFKELEPKLARKVLKQAEKKALGVPRSQAIANTPVLSGRMKKSIRIRAAKGPRSAARGSVSMALLVGGAAGGKNKKGVKLPWWAFLIERGWTLGKRIRSGGKVVGRNKVAGGNRHIAGKHIMKRALRATEGQIKQVMTVEILAGIERELGR
jgi:hypothetical protein